jgi:hypothetical protein
MENHHQANDGEGKPRGPQPRVTGCCLVQLAALCGCVWTGLSLGLRYAKGGPLLPGIGKVLLGLVLGFIAGVLAAIVILYLDHLSEQWALRRYRRMQGEDDSESEGGAQPGR